MMEKVLLFTSDVLQFLAVYNLYFTLDLMQKTKYCSWNMYL